MSDDDNQEVNSKQRRQRVIVLTGVILFLGASMFAYLSFGVSRYVGTTQGVVHSFNTSGSQFKTVVDYEIRLEDGRLVQIRSDDFAKYGMGDKVELAIFERGLFGGNTYRFSEGAGGK